jgi:hypothetical protein
MNINNKNVKKNPNVRNRKIPNANNKQVPHMEPTREAKTVSLFSQPYLDTYNQCYKNIVVVNLSPRGPLSSLVRRVNFPPLSEFKQPGPCTPLKQCGYALMSLSGCDRGCGKKGSDLMVVDEVPDLISYLVSNGYSVDTSITKMFNTSEVRFGTNTGNKLICFVTYNG